MYRLIVIFIFLCMSCRNRADYPAEATPKRLSSVQIIELIEDLAIQSDINKNFHFLYNEHLNDSTWVIRLQQNNELGNEEFGICEVLKFDSGNIFVYDDGQCYGKLEENLKSNNMPFQLDGISFHLLVEKRRGRLEYYTLKKRFRFDNSPDSIDDPDSPF